MIRTGQISLADKYLVDDLPGAAQSGTRLNGILVKIDAAESLTRLAQEFLTTKGLDALQALVNGRINWEVFQQKAAVERAQRIEQADARAAKEVAELAALATQRDAAIKAHFAAMANDPKLRRQREAKELRQRFGIGYVESEHYPRVMALLRRVSDGRRLSSDDVAWLQTEAEYCWTDELQKAWHMMEAEALSALWQKRGDPWDAVNASSHWRKAGQSNMALPLTEAALTRAATAPKIRSALTTTRGGALRDLRRLDEAKALGLEANRLTPTDFRPCTLLGAIHIELGDLASGHDWYVKAEKLGADRRAVDQDLRALLAHASKTEQHRIREFLIAQDPERFAWLR